MTDSRCPDCGAPTSPGAAVCPSCGFPIRPHALPQGGGERLGIGGRARAGSGFGTSGLAVGVIAGVIFVVLLVGIVAAIPIAGMARERARESERVARESALASEREKGKQGEALLRWAYTAERMVHAEDGAYTASADSLARILSPPADSGAKQYTLGITAVGGGLCLDAVPVPGSGVAPRSMDAIGSFYRAAGCSGEFDASVPPGSGSEMGAWRMMREVHAGLAAYRAEQGRYPTAVAELSPRVRDTPAAAEYVLELPGAGAERACAAAVPREPGGGLRAHRVDQDGKLYEGAACAGAAEARFAPPTRGSSRR
ncbi:MAG TPA: zinc ribbon domain-containing protein [Longimicrobium sp.]|nr:zinc ribbon domain-containing protein [Longimicrobium sp.]